MEKKQTRILVPAGALGISYSPEALEWGLAHKPDLIAIDGGSTDSGPFYLGTGTSKYSRSATKNDWSRLIKVQTRAQVPLLIGTAGTCGANDAVDWMVDITKEICREQGLHLRIAILRSQQDPELIAEAWRTGRLTALPGAPALTEDVILSCQNIVALAGVEQIQAALATNADIIIAGRATDTAVIAALPIAQGCHQGAAWHGAKIAECGALATNNPNTGVILMDFDEEGFTITPMDPNTQATPYTVSAHMLYENSDPHILPEPGGYLDVSQAHYKPVNDRSVRVTGSQWKKTDPYTVKLEGARLQGYQTVTLVLVRHSRYVENIDLWTQKLSLQFKNKIQDTELSDVALDMRVVGKNATLGSLETRESLAPELGVLAIFTAKTQKQARDAARLLNPDLLHLPLTPDEPMPTFAFPFSPPEMDKGPIYEFCLHHVLALRDPMEIFSIDVQDI